MADKFEGHSEGLSSPPTRGFSIAPNDNADLTEITRCINVAETGYVRVTTSGNDTIDLFVAAGIPFPIRAERVWEAGTTATGIVGLY